MASCTGHGNQDLSVHEVGDLAPLAYQGVSRSYTKGWAAMPGMGYVQESDPIYWLECRDLGVADFCPSVTPASLKYLFPQIMEEHRKDPIGFYELWIRPKVIGPKSCKESEIRAVNPSPVHYLLDQPCSNSSCRHCCEDKTGLDSAVGNSAVCP